MGCAASAPKIVLIVVLCAYARGIMASRQIACACQENSTVMALAYDRVPAHRTPAALVSCRPEERISMFRAFLLVCAAHE
jgi:hypothetical protein